MLETNLTMYQLLSEFEKKEYLQRIINLLNSDKNVCDKFDKVLNTFESHIANKNIILPQMYPDYES